MLRAALRSCSEALTLRSPSGPMRDAIPVFTASTAPTSALRSPVKATPARPPARKTRPPARPAARPAARPKTRPPARKPSARPKIRPPAGKIRPPARKTRPSARKYCPTVRKSGRNQDLFLIIGNIFQKFVKNIEFSWKSQKNNKKMKI